MNVVSAVLLVVFAVMGIIALIREITCLIFGYKGDNSIMLVAPISGKCEDAELVLRSALSKVRWTGRGKHDCVICLDCDMDDETKRICEKICNEYGFAKLMSKSEFFEILNQPVR